MKHLITHLLRNNMDEFKHDNLYLKPTERQVIELLISVKLI